MYVPHNTKKVRHARMSKHNTKCENQVILLMITDGEKQHYLSVKSLSALLKGITSKHDGDFYCLNCFQAYTSDNKLKKHKGACENHYYCRVKMPKEDNKILKYNQGEKSLKNPFDVYGDLESLIEKISTCCNNPEKSSATKIDKHTPSGFSLFTHCSFDATKNKVDYYRGKDCLKVVCKILKEHAIIIIIMNYEKNKIVPLTKEVKKTHRWAAECYVCKEKFSTDNDDKKHYKVKDHCHYTGKYRGVARNICNLRYKTSREIIVILHNGSTYDYHLIIKELAEEFVGPFECLGENTEKYITFSVPIKKQFDNGESITYKTKFIDSFRFMSRSLSTLVDNLADINCKKCDNKREYNGFKDNNLLVECCNCNAWFKKDTEELIKRFANSYQFSNKDLNKFILLLRKGVYPHEYMDNWETFVETSLSNKAAFYSNLNMEDITDADYRHANKVFKEFKLKPLGEYHDFYVQRDTLLLADVLENFRNICMKVYELDPAYFLTAPGLVWKTCLKKAKVEFELLTDIDMLLIVEKGSRGGICQAV